MNNWIKNASSGNFTEISLTIVCVRPLDSVSRFALKLKKEKRLRGTAVSPPYIYLESCLYSVF